MMQRRVQCMRPRPFACTRRHKHSDCLCVLLQHSHLQRRHLDMAVLEETVLGLDEKSGLDERTRLEGCTRLNQHRDYRRMPLLRGVNQRSLSSGSSCLKGGPRGHENPHNVRVSLVGCRMKRRQPLVPSEPVPVVSSECNPFTAPCLERRACRQQRLYRPRRALRHTS